VPTEKWTDVGPPVEIVDGVTVFEHGTLHLTDYHGYDLVARVEFDGERVVLDEITVRRRDGGEPVTGEALREIAVQSILRAHIRAAIQVMGQGAPDVKPGEPVRAQGLLSPATAERLRQLGPEPETLQWVARVYRVSDAVGDPPTKAVRQTFGISQSAAGNWIGRARSAGLIPPGEEGECR
jgi:hypothetical protein